MSLHVYSIRLRNGKYYVGSTTDVDRRFQQHLDGAGAEWTRIHAPACRDPHILATNASPLDEDKFTKQLMLEHGIDNVRGGSYCSIVLTDLQTAALQAELRSATNACHACGDSGHFIRECPLLAEESEQAESACDVCNERGVGCHSPLNCPALSMRGASQKKRGPPLCQRCGRDSHSASQCFATLDVQGNPLTGNEEDDDTDESGDDSGDTCGRCGRGGHVAKSCYARTSVNGKFIGKRR